MSHITLGHADPPAALVELLREVAGHPFLGLVPGQCVPAALRLVELADAKGINLKPVAAGLAVVAWSNQASGVDAALAFGVSAGEFMRLFDPNFSSTQHESVFLEGHVIVVHPESGWVMDPALAQIRQWGESSAFMPFPSSGLIFNRNLPVHRITDFDQNHALFMIDTAGEMTSFDKAAYVLAYLPYPDAHIPTPLVGMLDDER